ncbi:MAG: SDR family oxidoreductase [Bacteroidaceae bacterium]|nr:SDR family oxidoreductase [Bacteroidaceae bacterium]
MYFIKQIKRVLCLFQKEQVTYANITYSTPANLLAGKKILIIGGGRGLGAAMAEKFVNEGADVLISGRNNKMLKETSEKIGCKYLALDVSDVQSHDDFIRQADESLGGMNVLVNNAGISLHERTFFDVTPDSFDEQINVNLKGSFFMAQKIISLWLKRKQAGTILFTSSETGEMADYRPYGFTKAMINSMTQGLACMFAKKGIRINAIAPGVTCSDMTGRKADDDLTFRKNALGRVYLPEEVAETAAFLISECSGCISGQILTCNNGRSINTRLKQYS